MWNSNLNFGVVWPNLMLTKVWYVSIMKSERQAAVGSMYSVCVYPIFLHSSSEDFFVLSERAFTNIAIGRLLLCQTLANSLDQTFTTSSVVYPVLNPLCSAIHTLCEWEIGTGSLPLAYNVFVSPPSYIVHVELIRVHTRDLHFDHSNT